jgi:hypothetical protein
MFMIGVAYLEGTARQIGSTIIAACLVGNVRKGAEAILNAGRMRRLNHKGNRNSFTESATAESPLHPAAIAFIRAENLRALKNGEDSGIRFQFVSSGGNFRTVDRNQNMAATPANRAEHISSDLLMGITLQ